ncbi:helix-turn-helix domain-containing protein [Kitasatospora sp. RB6PN24]|uniref:helix-turn-helix domain-containing protein n=1 Tax=Kitasatospora humi TaxID=2893891 RepID=UPI001E2826E3|nr:helix-turn-helix domain-containing protein [Kitasatospora humi]MCC9308442.1 helix-turn-helix domain-containing protein [Kitasatospora humi]
MDRLDGTSRVGASGAIAGTAPGDDRPEGCPETVLIPIAALLTGEPLRSTGHDVDHVMRLAGLDTPFPPILVERRTMRVIDGTHRLLAAVLRSRESIEATFFDGPPEDAFLRAVEANVSHGLPLSLADRRTAVERIVITHPSLSDRAIARIAGVGAKMVAGIRKRSTAAVPQLDGRAGRMGRDGRVRPVDAAAGRLRVAELIARHPQASVRELARIAGVSPATASDVRKRLREGESALATGRATAAAKKPDVAGSDVTGSDVTGGRGRRLRLVRADPAELLEKLIRDPSLRHKEEGRQLLRLLRQNSLRSQEWTELTAVVPAHCGALVVSLARQYAAVWQEFARELDERMRSLDTHDGGRQARAQGS